MRNPRGASELTLAGAHALVIPVSAWGIATINAIRWRRVARPSIMCATHLQRRFVAILLAATLAACARGDAQEAESARVLFFGNSITYVGNLPAVFSALCGASGRHCSTEMVVQGGAVLADRIADGSLDRAAGAGGFDHLILQERGGDLMGARMNHAERQQQAETAAAALVRDAREKGMKPVLLGTYQGDPESSRTLVAAERALAAKLDSSYVPISTSLDCGRRNEASLRWFDRDGMHPGPALTLLMAAALYRELFGSDPHASELVVRAPIYGVSSGLRADAFASKQPVLPETPLSIDYDAATVRSVIEVLDEQ
ncbi:MAG TPA: hypothetical protein VFJ95_14485, partial [Gammaproteobacteria bacterium]|nr:hypothetical protein [Gammaproteobacteria bacterium]